MFVKLIEESRVCRPASRGMQLGKAHREQSLAAMHAAEWQLKPLPLIGGCFMF
jgi:hypothetical protein